MSASICGHSELDKHLSGFVQAGANQSGTGEIAFVLVSPLFSRLPLVLTAISGIALAIPQCS